MVWLTFSPTAGHEQSGRRPALVLSPAAYNARVGLAICCPITNHVKGYPFEVELPTGLAVGRRDSRRPGEKRGLACAPRRTGVPRAERRPVRRDEPARGPAPAAGVTLPPTRFASRALRGPACGRPCS
ncbi:MAG: type II toxin-antitoxin system PemK/MazF family toxin [Sphingobacterium sp.]|nr:type II toxin-antitoxin system PemK/MazF family toxin [Sphingobacterium sp.]